MVFRFNWRWWSVAVAGVALLTGCPPKLGPDSHTEVFVNRGQAATRRAVEQQHAWLETAAALVKELRPEVKVTTLEPLTVNIDADGVHRSIDLAAVEPALAAPSSQPREVLRTYLEPQLREYDQERLKALRFAGAKALLEPRLVNSAGIDALTTQAGKGVLHTTPVVGGMAWTPVVRWPGRPDAVPLSADVLNAWQTPLKTIDSAALDNIRQGLDATAIVTVPFGGDRAGNLTAGVNPAVVLLPEFLKVVRQAWNSTDDLVMILGTGRDVSFVERGRQRLLARLYPLWQQRLLGPTALCSTLLLLDEKGLTPFNYAPPLLPGATQPATKPATKPYIVR